MLHHVQAPHLTSRVAERAFVRWLVQPDKPDELRLGGPDAPATPLTWTLGELCTSRHTLPPIAAAVLGCEEGLSVGQAATELLLAVNDPAGPRCRSYRAATYYLRERALLGEVFADLEAVSS
ncbi:hypothetical protein [Egicoccus sp. AB-alg2]|uniref:hypothetical protein n=1 Tax=Egicoccus sp. AB-alg2 TaxID=3242693 RepID=UPI00359D028C